MRRYRVRSANKKWSDRGPDLLRTRSNAVEQVQATLSGTAPFSVRKRRNLGRWWKPQRVGSKQNVAKYLNENLTTLSAGQVLQVLDSEGRVRTLVRAEAVEVKNFANATGKAEVVWALFSYQFRGARFGGIYACKRKNGDPNANWSVHAWGDAVDISENRLRRVYNDDLFDWGRRMAMENLLPVELGIGSRNGVVVSTREAERWTLDVGGTDSHKWHNHWECRERTGTPPCA